MKCTISILKLTLSVYCVSSYVFHHALSYWAETWHEGRENMAPENLWAYFETPLPKIKGHLEVKLPYKCPMATKFGRLDPWLKCNALLESNVMKGSSGVNLGSICVALNALWLNFERTTVWSVMHWGGQRSCRCQLGPTRANISYKCPMATRFGRKNPWSKCNAVLGQRSLESVCPPIAVLLRRYWNFVQG